MFDFSKKNIIQALVIGGGVTLALGFVAGKGVLIRMATGAAAAFVAVPLAVQIGASA